MNKAPKKKKKQSTQQGSFLSRFADQRVRQKDELFQMNIKKERKSNSPSR